MPLVERFALTPDLSISRVLTGLWQVADMERDQNLDTEQAALALLPYAEAGFTTFDMADHYGSAELIAGKMPPHLPEQQQIQLFTKWVPKPGVITRKDVEDAVQLALQRLGSERIDLMQYHAWDYAHPGWLDGLFWLQELAEEGLIRHIGLTNFDAVHLNMVLESGVAVVSNQVSYSMIDQRAAGELSEVCRRHKVSLLAYGTVAGGFLSERWLGLPEPDWDNLQTWSQMKYGRFIREAGGWEPFQRLLQGLKQVADRHKVSIPNVACRYILQAPAVAGIIIGARPGENNHLADNLRLFQFELDEEDYADLAQAREGLSAIPGDCGDEYRRPPFLTASGDLSHHLAELPVPYQTRELENGNTVALSGTVWESLAGYCRALRRGKRIFISGTTATHGVRVIGGKDAVAQTHFIIDKIEGALRSLGAGPEQVVRTRIYVRDIAEWEVVARAHGRRFADILPVNTLVEARLVGEEYRVEIEAEAILP